MTGGRGSQTGTASARPNPEVKAANVCVPPSRGSATQVLYTATALGGRQGHVRSSDGVLDVPLLYPEELGGPGGANNPEQLLRRDRPPCFENALMGVARERKTLLQGSSVTAHVGIGRG